MFCDLVGSTRLSGQRDVESTFVTINAYYDACRAAVERQGGVIAQHQGDGIFVWFGYPRTHDDDAIRAVRAGLDVLASIAELSTRLESEIGTRLAARVGVHTGEALVAPVAETDTLTAYGYTPNLAAKLQQNARPGTLVVSDAVLRLVRGRFDVAPRPPVDLGDAVVSAHVVLGEQQAQGRLGRRWRTPLVGRVAERDRLRTMWGSVRAGQAAVVALVGTRGIGKTRLAGELLSAASEQQARVLDCTCGDLHTNTPYHTFRALLATAAGIELDHLPDDAAGLLREHLVGTLGLPRDSVTLLGGLLGLPKEAIGPPPDVDPSMLAQLTNERLVAWLNRLAAEPMVVVVDDVTAADPSSLSVLELLVADPPPRLLLAFTVRSDVPPPALLSSHAVQVIEVLPLKDAECAALVDAVTDGALDPDRRREVLAQGEGVPLFLEELAHTAREEPAGAGLPITLTGHLQARLLAPRLDQEISGLLAVAGGELDETILTRVIGADSVELSNRMQALVASDLVSPSGARYRFRHGLISEAAYGLLLREQRRRLHGALADALARPPSSGRVNWDVVGRHLRLANRALDAFEAILQGADEAGRTGAFREALRGYADALEVLTEVSDPTLRDQLEVRCRVAKGGTATAAGGFGSDDAAAEFDRCAELCRRLGASPEHLSAIIGMLSFYTTRGEPAVGRRLCNEVQSWVDAGDEQYRADHALLVGLVDFYEGDYRAASERMARAVELFDRHPREAGRGTSWLLPYDPVVIAMLYHGTLLWIGGRADDGRAVHARAVSRAVQVEFPAGPFSLAYVRSHQGWTAALTGDHFRGASFAREVRAIGRRHGFAFWESCGEIHVGISEYWLTGRPDPLEAVERHANIWNRIGGLAFLPYVSTAVASIRAELGDHRAAAAGFQAADELAAATGLRFYEAERLRHRALTPLVESQQVVPGLRRAWQLANRQGAWLFELRAALELVRRRDRTVERRLSGLIEGREPTPEYPEIDQARALLAGVR